MLPERMDAVKKLPDAEFQVMKAIWGMAPPVTSASVMEALPPEQAARGRDMLRESVSAANFFQFIIESILPSLKYETNRRKPAEKTKRP